ncbi:MAG: hypothetical protein JO002_17285 [Burkholderiaceae bacterium]|nr:hypothetical protein [Burkholderiaceae bacterium]
MMTASPTPEDDFWHLLTQTPVPLEKFTTRKVQVPSDANSLYLLEFLIADTLALLDEHCEWIVSGVGPDGGIDFEANSAMVRVGLFDLEIRTTLLGQIKRMKKFSDDRLRSAMTKFEDLRRNRTVTAVLFVISSSDDSDMIKSRVVDHQNYCSGLNLPRHYLDVQSFIRLWAGQKQYLRGVLRNALPEPQADFVLDTVLRLSGQSTEQPSSLCVSVQLPNTAFTAHTPFRVRINIAFAHFMSLQTIRLRYEQPSSSPPLVVIPSALGMSAGAEYSFRNAEQGQIDLWLRADCAGSQALGQLLVWEAGREAAAVSVDLETVRVIPHFSPRYFHQPNMEAHQQTERLLRNAKGGLVAVAFVVGAGGAGKSAFCQHVGDYALDHGFQLLRHAISDTTDQRADLGGLATKLFGNPQTSGLPHTAHVVDTVRSLIGDQQAVLEQLQTCLESSTLALQPRELSIGLCALLVRRLQQGPVMLHIQDLHWAGKPLLDTLSFLIAGLRDAAMAHGASLRFGALFMLEGRDGEGKFSKARGLSIQPWMDFQASVEAQRIVLKPWDQKHSREMIETCLLPRPPSAADDSGDMLLRREIVAYIHSRGRGSPMHMVEQTRLLFDDGTLVHDMHGQVILQSGLRNPRAVPEDVDEVIRDRWRYLHSTKPDLAEMLVVLAKTGRMHDRSYVDHLLACCQPPLTAKDLERTNCIQLPGDRDVCYQFVHENYVQALRELTLDGRSTLLVQALAWHQAHANSVDRLLLNWVKLMILGWQPPYEQAIGLASALLERTRVGALPELKGEVLRTLMCIPREQLERAGLHLEDLSLELAGCLAGNCSWDESLAELERLLASGSDGDDEVVWLARAEACAEKANLLVDLQRTHEALQAVVTGTELVQALRDAGVPPSLQPRRESIADKLLHRHAVALWFDGRHTQALSLQRAAHRRALARGDQASLAVILREQGTLRLHRHVSRGRALLRKAVALGLEARGISLVDQRVAEVQVLMADLLVLAQTQPTPSPEEFEFVATAAMQRYHQCRKEGFAYEPALAAQIAGCAALAAGDKARAQRCFELAALQARVSNLPHIIWQSSLNLAQLHLELGAAPAVIQRLANQACRVLRIGLDADASPERRRLMALPLRQAERCGAHDEEGWLAGQLQCVPPLHDRLAPLHYRSGNATYFLMC